MKTAVLQIFPALLLVVTYYGASFSGKERGVYGFPDREQSGMIEAAACIGIILHHLAQQVTVYGTVYKGPVTWFNDLGFLFTSVFFFFSGFGLIVNLDTKPGYLNTFLQKRLPSVLIPFWVINLFGVILNTCVYGLRINSSGIFFSIFGLRLVNSNGWFIIEIVLFYLLFYLFFRFIRNRDAALVLLCLAVVFVIVFSFDQGHDPSFDQSHWFRGEWWFNSTIAFAAGLLTARFRGKMSAHLHRYYAFWFPFFAMMSAAALLLSVYFVDHYGYYQDASMRYARYCAAVTLAAQTAACLSFTMFMLLFHMRVKVGNRALKYLSSVSRELFLIHGYFVNRIFGNIRMSDFLRFTLVIACSLACTAVLSPCIRLAVRSVSRILLRLSSVLSSLPSPVSHLNVRRQAAKAMPVMLAVCLVLPAGLILMKDLRERTEYSKECEALREASVGEEIYWGHYDTDPAKIGRERLSWIVIERDGNRLCLISRDGIAGSCYHQKHEAVSWENSDLRALLNSKAFTKIFSRYEKETIRTVNGDLITLLTVDQAEKLFASDGDRVMSVTDAAKRSGTNAEPAIHQSQYFTRGYNYSWWWLRQAEGQESLTAPFVDIYGSIFPDSKAVNKPRGALRPVIWVSP